MPNDYEWDVFFSYKRDPLTAGWYREVVNRLRFWLTQELGGQPARIFIDESQIETGDHWPVVLQQALRYSKCMVAVWLPSYFQSRWCMSEWRSFLLRERQANLAPHGLIAPMRFHDSEFFPLEAQDIQWLDVAPYASTLPAFWSTTKADEFEQQAIKPFAKSVAQVVRRAPPFDPDWLVEEHAGLAAPRIPLARL